MSGSDAEPLPWPEQWATQLAVDVGEARQHIAIARTHGLDAEHSAIADAAESLAGVAAAAVRRRPGPRSSRVRRNRSLLDRWRGASVERAFQSLHAARVFLLDLLPEDEVRARSRARSPASGGCSAATTRAGRRRDRAVTRTSRRRG
jgi:hypothetical protein